MVKALAACLLVLALVLTSRSAAAHPVGVSKGTYAATGAVVSAEITAARADLASAVPALDTDDDGTLDEAELAAGATLLQQAVVETIAVDAEGAGCKGTLAGADLVESDGVTVRATYACAAPPSVMRVEVKLLDALPPGHRHLARASIGDSALDAVLHRAQEEVVVHAGSTGPTSFGFAAFLWMGIQHILTGYDHLIFLFGLVLVGGRVRSLVGVVTAFTVAHSITLAVAALGAWVPPPRLVEAAIALSIVYVGVENFFVKSAEGRWRITFPFGLVHGFGFASALRQAMVSHAHVPVALVGFNLGVEIGQLAVLAALVPLLVWMRKKNWIGRRAVLRLSACVVGAGVALVAVRLTQ